MPTTTGFELPEVIPKGERNNTMLAFVGSVRDKGLPESVLTLAVRQTNQERFKPPLDYDELQDLIDRFADQARAEGQRTVKVIVVRVWVTVVNLAPGVWGVSRKPQTHINTLNAAASFLPSNAPENL